MVEACACNELMYSDLSSSISSAKSFGLEFLAHPRTIRRAKLRLMAVRLFRITYCLLFSHLRVG
jgi:hypothetical protein